jgi:ubiquitin-conjugating enzyme E2 N
MAQKGVGRAEGVGGVRARGNGSPGPSAWEWRSMRGVAALRAVEGAVASVWERVQEMERLQKDPVAGISVSPFADNFRHLNVSLEGPADTPYAGGIFRLEMFLPTEYPMVPPKVRAFRHVSRPRPRTKEPRTRSLRRCASSPKSTTPTSTNSAAFASTYVRWSGGGGGGLRVWVGDDGGWMGAQILKDKWSPALQVRSVLLSLQALMSAPNPTDPLNEEAATKWREDEAAAHRIAREMTEKFATV